MSQRASAKTQQPPPLKSKGAEVTAKQYKPTAEDEERYRALFNNEEQESEQRDRLADVGLCKRTCAEISACLEEIAALKSGDSQNPKVTEALNEKRIDVLMKIALLKKLNRLMQTRLRRVRERTNEARVHVDTRNAQLENSQYELVQLNSEIRKCLDFAAREEHVDVVKEDEFFEALQRDGRSGEAASLRSADSHSKNVARLNYELSERTRLEEAATQLRNQCDSVRGELERRESYLDAVLPLCRTLAEAAKPLERALGLKESDAIEQHALAGYLPDALYTIYLHLEALSQVDDARSNVTRADLPEATLKQDQRKTVAVELDGDLETTRAWYDCGYLEKIEEETDADWLAASRARETEDDAEVNAESKNGAHNVKTEPKKRHARSHGQSAASKKRKADANGQSGSSSESEADEDDAAAAKQQPATDAKRNQPNTIAKARLFVAHPIAIVLRLTVFDGEIFENASSQTAYTFALRIEYLIRLKLATCKFTNANEVYDAITKRISCDRSSAVSGTVMDARSIVTRVLDADGLLVNLLEFTSDGDTFAPSRFNALQFERGVDASTRGGFASRDVRAQFGIPFNWLQTACGMHVLNERHHAAQNAAGSSSKAANRTKRPSQPLTTVPKASSVEQLVDAIRARFAYRVRLANELAAIANGSFIPSTHANLWNMFAFKMVSFEDLQQSTVAGRLVLALLNDDTEAEADTVADSEETKQCLSRFDFCFRLVLSRHPSPDSSSFVQLVAYLIVPHRDRSDNRALMAVSLDFYTEDRITEQRSAANDTRLFEIERKLNVDDCSSSQNFDLSARVARLVEYIDVYLHVGNSPASQTGGLQFLRAGKGPSRTPPLSKIEKLNLLVHDEHM